VSKVKVSSAAAGSLVGDVADILCVELVGLALFVSVTIDAESTLARIFCLWTRSIFLVPPELATEPESGSPS
jgi:hypothetical protein